MAATGSPSSDRWTCWPTPRRQRAQLKIPIIYEDESILAVDKPAGVATHGFSGRDGATLANFLAAHRPEVLHIGKSRWEPGLVHRLDIETSGVVVIAKTQVAFDSLREQFRRREVKKIYMALIWGQPLDRGTIELALAHDRGDRTAHGRGAATRAEPRPPDLAGDYALSRCC